jgi:hypothetical protein
MSRKLIRLLLPRSWFWQSATSKLDGVWTVIADQANAIKLRMQQVIRDAYPRFTSKLDDWEEELGLPTNLSLSEDERRERIEGKLFQNNTGSLASIQEKLQRYGFDLYVHAPYQGGQFVNPNDYLASAATPPKVLTLGSATLGSEQARLGAISALPEGYPLVNIAYYLAQPVLTLGSATLGSSTARLGAKIDVPYIVPSRNAYQIPTDPDKFPFFIYIGGASFGEFTTISNSRRFELERLLLQITPKHIWKGMLINYA